MKKYRHVGVVYTSALPCVLTQCLRILLNNLNSTSYRKRDYRPRLLGWSNRRSPQNKFVSFSDFASFCLLVCMMLKTHSEACKIVLNFQRGFGCLIGWSCLKIVLSGVDGYERAVFTN